jgi:adenylate cyclase
MKARPVCVPDVMAGSRRTPYHAERADRHRRVLNVTAMISAAITAFFGFQGLLIGQDWWITLVNLGSAAAFVLIPRLCGMHEIVAPVVFFVVSYLTITVLCIHVGTGSGLQFYYVVAAAIMLVVLGTDHIVLAATLSAVGAVTVILLEFLVPNDTGTQPPWTFRASFVLTVITAWILVIATIWFALREIRRAREAMEAEYERSEQLLTNILPATIAARLKDPSRTIIADKYDDASILFADIAGYTARERHHAERPRAIPGPALHRSRSAGRPARPGEGEDQRRLVHGGQRGAGATARPR